MLRHVVNTLREAVDEILVVAAKDDEIPSVAAHRVDDREPGLGPLAGIREGLAAMRAGHAFVTGTDAPWISAACVAEWVGRERTLAPQHGGYVQTLAAVYSKRGAALADQLLRNGRRRPLDLLEALDYECLEGSQLPPDCEFRTLNTPTDYLRAAREDDPQACATLEFFGRARLILGEQERKVPIGTLAEIVRHAEPQLDLIRGGKIAGDYRVALNGRDLICDPEIPIGPGERVVVIDASAGG